MEFKTDALVLRTAAWEESGKIVTLLTPGGKMSVGMKGVRKAGAKLAAASQLFCFGEYVIAERNRRRTAIGASIHESFYELHTDLIRMMAGACVTEVCDAVALEEMDCRALLFEALKSLEEIVTAEGAPMSAVLGFYLRALAFAGYPVSAGDCPFCGKKIVGRRYFDMDNGAFGCSTCAVGVPASEVTYDAVKFHLEKQRRTENVASMSAIEPTQDGTVRAVRMLRIFIEHQTGARLRAVEDLLSVY